jgi:hypothetical protein
MRKVITLALSLGCMAVMANPQAIGSRQASWTI